MDDHNYQMGALTEAVKTLTKAVEHLTGRLETLENKYRFGRGVFFGLLVGAGFLAYGAKGMILKFLGIFL